MGRFVWNATRALIVAGSMGAILAFAVTLAALVAT